MLTVLRTRRISIIYNIAGEAMCLVVVIILIEFLLPWVVIPGVHKKS